MPFQVRPPVLISDEPHIVPMPPMPALDGQQISATPPAPIQFSPPTPILGEPYAMVMPFMPSAEGVRAALESAPPHSATALSGRLLVAVGALIVIAVVVLALMEANS